MPCPPSYEEMQFFRMDRESAEIKDQLANEQSKIDGLNELILQVNSFVSFGMTPELEEKIKVLTKRDFTKSISPFSQRGISQEDVNEYAAYIRNGETMLKYAEIHQCELRTLLMVLWRMTPITIQQSDSIKEKIKVQRIIHLEHRMEDRECVVNNLKMELMNESNPVKKEEIETEMKKILAIPLEELLYDRNLF